MGVVQRVLPVVQVVALAPGELLPFGLAGFGCQRRGLEPARAAILRRLPRAPPATTRPAPTTPESDRSACGADTKTARRCRSSSGCRPATSHRRGRFRWPTATACGGNRCRPRGSPRRSKRSVSRITPPPKSIENIARIFPSNSTATTNQTIVSVSVPRAGQERVFAFIRQAEHQDVDQQDAQQRDAAQHVDGRNPLGRRHRIGQRGRCCGRRPRSEQRRQIVDGLFGHGHDGGRAVLELRPLAGVLVVASARFGRAISRSAALLSITGGFRCPTRGNCETDKSLHIFTRLPASHRGGSILDQGHAIR